MEDLPPKIHLLFPFCPWFCSRKAIVSPNSAETWKKERKKQKKQKEKDENDCSHCCHHLRSFCGLRSLRFALCLIETLFICLGTSNQIHSSTYHLEMICRCIDNELIHVITTWWPMYKRFQWWEKFVYMKKMIGRHSFLQIQLRSNLFDWWLMLYFGFL